MADWYLFLDFETTGLDPVDCTQLEVGWTVLDERLVQQSYLRRRYLALRASGAEPVVPIRRTPAWSGSHADYPPEIVRDMHRKSSLLDDWLDTPSVAIVRSIADLDRMWIDDLIGAGWTSKDKVYVAGAGVSHFDHLVLKAHRSKMVTEGVLHYAAVDSTVALRTLGIPAPKDAEAMDVFMDETLARVGMEHVAWATKLDTEKGPLRSLAPNLTIDTGACNPHRAPDDVAWSILLSRLLRLRAGSPNVGA